MENYNSKDYIPGSYFFTDYSKLATASTATDIVKSDSFGPVQGNNITTQYRTTSFVRATDSTKPVKVFAVCDGQILIQPSVTAGKINIILKPENCYAPLKIKYFVYRNVNKEDLFSSSILIKDTTDTTFDSEHTAPTLLTDLWTSYTNFNGSKPDKFSASFIGYDESASTATTTLIDSYFTSTSSSFVLPYCCAGDHIGYFTDKIGLDVVLDNGDCKLIDTQDQLFKFDLTYARKSEHVFDTSSVTQTTGIIKRYREYILQFMDAAAFWGSHINCGGISLTGGSSITKIKLVSDVYTDVLSKYQTANRQYIYITEERGRSYGYYDASGSERTVCFTTNAIDDPTNLSSNYTASSWPILIEEFTFTDSVNEKSSAYGYLQYNIASSIVNEKHISIDLFAPDTTMTSYPRAYTSGTTGSNTFSNVLTYSIHVYNATSGGTGSYNLCANFLMISCNVVQTAPLENYFNHLFPSTIIPSNYSTADTDGYTKWGIYDQNRMEYLLPVADLSAKVYNKVVTDTQNGVKRRLFMAIIKENTKQTGTKACAQYQKLNVAPGISGYDNVSTTDMYMKDVYGDTNFSVYRGKFYDGSYTPTYSLSLINTDDFEAKKSFFQLGITEAEFTGLITNTSLSTGADNIFFKLKEVYADDIQNADYRKFELGFTYEESNANTIVELYPSAGNKLYIYSLDGFYFFSAAYSVSQAYYDEFANIHVNFRPLVVNITKQGTRKDNGSSVFFDDSTACTITDPSLVYTGNFGFDWLRMGDNNIDQYAELPYAQIIANGYRPDFDGVVSNNGGNTNEWDNVTQETTNYMCGTNTYKALLREYNSIPTSNIKSINLVALRYPISGYPIVSGDTSDKYPKIHTQYYVSYLNLFSRDVSINICDNDKLKTEAPYEAHLRLVIDKSSTTDLYCYIFKYNNKLFDVESSIATDETNSSFYSTATITCIGSFDTTQQISVWAYLQSESESNAKLAGMILVGGNDTSYRKKMKVVYVPISIKPDLLVHSNTVQEGTTEFIQKMCFQDFIVSDVESYTKSDDNSIDYTTSDGTTYFNLEDDPNFKLTGNAFVVQNTYTDASGNTITETVIDRDKTVNGQEFLPYLKSVFFSRNGNSENYSSSKSVIYIFFLPLLCKRDTNGSRTTAYSPIGERNVVAFANTNAGITAHEAGHSLGFKHCHRDLNLALEPIQKFVYYQGADIYYRLTDNVMSYCPTGLELYDKNSTWKWQWDLLNKEVKNI